MSDELTNGAYEADDFGPIGDAARQIASYCEGEARKNVYRAAKAALSSTQPPLPEAPGDVEAMREACAKVAEAEAATLKLACGHDDDEGKADRWYTGGVDVAKYIATAIRSLHLPKAMQEEVEPVAFLYTHPQHEAHPLQFENLYSDRRKPWLVDAGYIETPLYTHPATRPEPVGVSAAQAVMDAGYNPATAQHIVDIVMAAISPQPEDKEAAGEGEGA